MYVPLRYQSLLCFGELAISLAVTRIRVAMYYVIGDILSSTTVGLLYVCVCMSQLLRRVQSPATSSSIL